MRTFAIPSVDRYEHALDIQELVVEAARRSPVFAETVVRRQHAKAWRRAADKRGLTYSDIGKLTGVAFNRVCRLLSGDIAAATAEAERLDALLIQSRDDLSNLPPLESNPPLPTKKRNSIAAAWRSRFDSSGLSVAEIARRAGLPFWRAMDILRDRIVPSEGEVQRLEDVLGPGTAREVRQDGRVEKIRVTRAQIISWREACESRGLLHEQLCRLTGIEHNRLSMILARNLVPTLAEKELLDRVLHTSTAPPVPSDPGRPPAAAPSLARCEICQRLKIVEDGVVCDSCQRYVQQT